MDKLVEAGLTGMNIQTYPKNEKIWDIYAKKIPMIKSLTDKFNKDNIPTLCKKCLFKPHVAQVQAVKEILKTRQINKILFL